MNRPDFSLKRAVARADAPFLADDNDPAFIHRRPLKSEDNSKKSIKVLTISKATRILVNTIKRKDGKVATKQKIQTNYTQNVAVCLLAAGAVLGFADLLGGGLRACFVAALLIACLFIMAMDYRK